MNKVTLIITTYNRPDALELVLLSLKAQNHQADQILIADDGSTEATHKLIEKYQSIFSVPIQHVWQKDKGFRLARIRNLALAQATGEYILMIDGDMVLHPAFIESQKKHAQQGYYVQGSRVLLSEQLTQKSIQQKNTSFSPFQSGITNRLNAINSGLLSSLVSKEKNTHIGVRGCSMAFWKKDVIAINGFNEDFEGWGKEDSEFVIRLLNNGIKRKNLKLGGVAYHLYHPENTNHKNAQLLAKNEALLQKAIKEKSVWCEQGLAQHLG